MKNVVITGVSSGFGLLALRQLLHDGHRVIAGVRGGEERMRGMNESWIANALATEQLLVADVHLERAETLQTIAALVQQRWEGQLDVLINNAGFAQLGPLEPMSESDLRQQMEVNYLGPVLLIQACLPFLRRRGGRILNVSSALGYNTLPFYGSYADSKYALEAMTESLHYELKPFGIEVCLLEPGGFRTNFMGTAFKDKRRWLEHPIYRKRLERFDDFLANTSKNLGDPAVVAQVLCHYVTSRSVPLRRPLGVDGWLIAASHVAFPRFLYVRAIEFFFRKAVFKDGVQPQAQLQEARGEA